MAESHVVEQKAHLLGSLGWSMPRWGRGSNLTATRAAVLGMDGSRYHPYLATASADGAVQMLNVQRGIRGRGAQCSVQLCRLARSKKDDAVHVLENFLPITRVRV